MSAVLWRVLFAVLAVALVFTLIPPVCRILGFDLSGDVLTVVKVCIGGLALLYILKGPPPFPIT